MVAAEAEGSSMEPYFENELGEGVATPQLVPVVVVGGVAIGLLIWILS